MKEFSSVENSDVFGLESEGPKPKSKSEEGDEVEVVIVGVTAGEGVMDVGKNEGFTEEEEGVEDGIVVVVAVAGVAIKEDGLEVEVLLLLVEGVEEEEEKGAFKDSVK